MNQRHELQKATRRELIDYLESTGTACYADEPTKLLRECALETYDGLHEKEKKCPQNT